MCPDADGKRKQFRTEIVARKRRPHPRHIKVGLRKIAAHVGEHAPEVLLGLRMVDEFGLQHRKDFGTFFRRQMFMNFERIERVKCFFDHLLGQSA